MLKLIRTEYVNVKGKSKFPKEYQLSVYRCDKCSGTMKVDSDYVPKKCHRCGEPSGLKKDKERG